MVFTRFLYSTAMERLVIRRFNRIITFPEQAQKQLCDQISVIRNAIAHSTPVHVNARVHVSISCLYDMCDNLTNVIYHVYMTSSDNHTILGRPPKYYI